MFISQKVTQSKQYFGNNKSHNYYPLTSITEKYFSLTSRAYVAEQCHSMILQLKELFRTHDTRR